MRWALAGTFGIVIAAIATVAACHDAPSNGDVVGPFTGEIRTFAIDDFELPVGGDLQLTFGDDLDNDGIVDNQLGRVLSILATAGDDLTTHDADMIASGFLDSTLTIQANDFSDDTSVGVTFYGAGGEPATVVGGRLSSGGFRGNRTSTTKVPGAARAHLPVFADADPIVVDLIGLEIDIVNDYALVRGGIPEATARDAAFAGMTQMIRANPGGHLPFARLLDTNNDGDFSRAEFDANELVMSLLIADVVLDGTPALSVGFRVHLCAGCIPPAPDLCFDRIADGNEVGIDCGGSCPLLCATGEACTTPEDCRSNACATTCAAPTCSDGVADGLESDIDCGANCAPCAVGKICAADRDCASSNCNASLGHSGACAP